jgi:hypothetical protein
MATMMFLIRTAFWLMILVLLLPTDEKQQSQVYGTAEAAVKDVTGFCSRNPGVCEKGKDAFDVFVQKAQFGAQMIMGFVREQSGASAGEEQSPSEVQTPEPSSDADSPAEESGSAQADEARTQLSQATTPAWMPASLEPATVESLRSQDTLRPDDLAPAWSGPQAGV